MTLSYILNYFLKKFNNPLLFWYCSHYSCTGPKDDPFTACFGCAQNEKGKEKVLDTDYENQYGNIDRQVRERFRRTKRSRRVICRRNRSNCQIRIDKSIELRNRSYMRALEFVQSEEYLDQEDVDILLKFFFTWFIFLK